MKEIIIQGKIFKQFRETKYYCDEDGNIYSDFSQKILKPLVRKYPNNKNYYYVDINFGEGQKHVFVHRIVYETWVGSIPSGFQINHKDDNSLNNNYLNLYCGDQKENIKDCFENNHRVGNCWILTVYDDKVKQTITFCPAKDFIEYSGHPCKNSGLSRMFSRNWFKKRYKIISYYLCKSLEEKQSVTTNPDECKDVERINPPLEAYSDKNEEIV